MTNVIQGNFLKPSIDDLYSLPVTYTDNVVSVDFQKSQTSNWDTLVDMVLEDKVRDYTGNVNSLYLYANYLGQEGFDEEDVFMIIETIVNPCHMQYADGVIKEMVYNFNEYLEMC